MGWIAVGFYFAAMFCGDPWDKEEWRTTSGRRQFASIILIAIAACIALPGIYDSVKNMNDHDLLVGIAIIAFLILISVSHRENHKQ